MKTIGDRKIFETLAEIVDPAHTAVLVIDQQNDFTHPDGYYAKGLGLDLAMTQGITAPINELTAAARKVGVPVFFSRFVIQPGFVSDSRLWLGIHAAAGLKSLDQEAFYTIQGTWGADLLDEIVTTDEDTVFEKFRASAFHGTALDTMLKARGVESLIIAGQVAEGCVENTIRHARDYDYHTVLAKDAIGSVRREKYEMIINNWSARAQCPTVAELGAIWSGS